MKIEQLLKRRYRFPDRERAREFAREFADAMIPDADGSYWVYVVFNKAGERRTLRTRITWLNNLGATAPSGRLLSPQEAGRLRNTVPLWRLRFVRLSFLH